MYHQTQVEKGLHIKQTSEEYAENHKAPHHDDAIAPGRPAIGATALLGRLDGRQLLLRRQPCLHLLHSQQACKKSAERLQGALCGAQDTAALRRLMGRLIRLLSKNARPIAHVLKMVHLATPAMLRALATLSPVSIMTWSASSCLARSLNRRPNTGNQPSHLAGPLVRQLPRCRASKAAALLLLT